jgi:hypothetical protein
MMKISTSREAAHWRARIASLSRDRKRNDPDLIEARRNYRAYRLRDAIRDTLASQPPLTEEQRADLAAILLGTATEGKSA